MPPAASTPRKVSPEELAAFEIATRDLVGIALRSTEGAGLSLAQIRLLLVLADGPLSSIQVAQQLGVVASTVSRLADRVERSGHLRRGGDPANRSIVTLELTASGRQLVRRINARRRRELERALAGLSAEGRAAAAITLRELHEILLAQGRNGVSVPLPL